jgi:hypothetical protein
MQLQIASNNRYLIRADGSPFFWLADTAWQLFNYLSREEADWYLQTRAAQGFTVIQAVALAEFGCFDGNANGDAPLVDLDPAKPNEAYFAHVDWVVARAKELGLTIGFLPTWGDKWNQRGGAGPEIFTPHNAREYGKFLGRRYAHADVVWILGGDRPVESTTHEAIIRAMSLGLKEGEEEVQENIGTHLQTFHPSGMQNSAQHFHTDEWLDFNMWQTGHARNRACYNLIAQTYALEPAKPILDGEPGYEDYPDDLKQENGYLSAWDVRKFLHWNLFAGACGHTYGCHDVWQFWDGTRTPITFAQTHWRDALFLEGATQMQHARRLLEARPFITRVPDDSLLLNKQHDAPESHIGATRNDDGSYAFVYSAAGNGFTINTTKLTGATLRASWFDPRSGECLVAEEFTREASRDFTPPTSGENCDWILVLDDVARGYPAP